MLSHGRYSLRRRRSTRGQGGALPARPFRVGLDLCRLGRRLGMVLPCAIGPRAADQRTSFARTLSRRDVSIGMLLHAVGNAVAHLERSGGRVAILAVWTGHARPGFDAQRCSLRLVSRPDLVLVRRLSSDSRSGSRLACLVPARKDERSNAEPPSGRSPARPGDHRTGGSPSSGLCLSACARHHGTRCGRGQSRRCSRRSTARRSWLTGLASCSRRCARPGRTRLFRCWAPGVRHRRLDGLWLHSGTFSRAAPSTWVWFWVLE